MWGLTPERLPEVLVIGRVRGRGGPHPLDRFVAIPRYPWQSPCAVDLLLNSASALVDQHVVTCFGERLSVDVHGVIFTRFLDDGPVAPVDRLSDWAILKQHLHPRRTAELAQPELFTWSSAFNPAMDPWPGVSSIEQICQLTGDQQASLATDFLRFGLQALAAESTSTPVRLAAQRLVQMWERGLVLLHLTWDPYGALAATTGQCGDAARQVLPQPHGLAHVPARRAAEPGPLGTFLVPLQWVAVALRRPIVALVHLARVASFARDGYFHKLAGTTTVCSAPLHAIAEVPLFDLAVARADGVAAAVLDEAVRYDNRVYGIQVNRDDYCRAVEGKARLFGAYDDPSEPRGGGGEGGPGWGRGGDSTDFPRKPPRPRHAPAA